MYLTTQIIPSLQTIKILGDTDNFLQWMKKVHPEKDYNGFFDGYKFSLECCLNAFIDGVCGDQILGIENDFLLNRALAELVPLHHIASTCEKTIFLKNLKPHVKSILKTQNYKALNQRCLDFNNSISSRFDQIRKNNLVLSKETGLDAETANQFWRIDFVHTFLVQINNNGPTANCGHPFNVNWTREDRLSHYFEGYKYAIQFLWYQLLGRHVFNQTNLKTMHLADSWRDYKYICAENPEDPVSNMFNREFRLEEQTSFDSFFYWIKKEVTDPLSDKHGIPVYTIDDHFQFVAKGYDKRSLFGDLLDANNIQEVTPNMGLSDQIVERLYWYPFEIVNARESQMHHGISSFNTMLAGTVALHNPKVSGLPKVMVAKFIHPRSKDKNKNDYSYGILIDTKSAAGHYSSGWVIYQNVCGDYSGFSGSEHKSSEKLISKYAKQDKIELRELTITLKKFTEFTNEYVKDKKEISILEENKLVVDIIQKSRSNLFELFVYQLCVQFYGDHYHVRHSIDKKTTEGEKDIVIANDREVILIECKLNPQSCNFTDVLQKLEKKVATFPQKIKSCQLWFWEDLSPQNTQVLNQAIIEGNKLKTIVVSKPKGEQILKGADLKLLRYIMQDYKRDS